ncbi:MAG: endonuclease/exonuclease/phosphatase family protein [Planctomycetota bacterium]
MHALITALALLQPAETLDQRFAAEPSVRVDGDAVEFADRFDVLRIGDTLQIRMDDIGYRSLTGGPENVALLLDLDGNAATGADLTRIGGTPGIDLRIDFNAVWPEPKPGERGQRGSMVTAYEADGTPVNVHQWEIGLLSAPTHAADEFEVRINTDVVRREPEEGEAPAEPVTLPEVGDVRGVILVQDRGNQRTVARKRLMAGVGSAVPTTFAEASVPAKPDDSIRVMVWNMLYDGPDATPQPFADTIEAVAPDVVMIQEWSRDPMTDERVATWFDEHVEGEWFVETSSGQGVAIVSRFPIAARGPDFVEATPENTDDPSARVASAVLETPGGPMTFATVHLKCCGYLNSREDEKRRAEAAAAAKAITALHTAGPIVFAGDFNLVGSPNVLDVELPTPMRTVTPTHLADPSLLYTWQDPNQNFGRSRLDYFLNSESLQEANAFIVDPATLGIENPSDHLPIVVDLKR